MRRILPLLVVALLPLHADEIRKPGRAPVPRYGVQWKRLPRIAFRGNAAARACYVVKTHPAGMEGNVRWQAVCEGGAVTPAQGRGGAFEVIVTCADPRRFRLTVSADKLAHKQKIASELSASDIEGREQQLPAQPFHLRLDESGVGVDEPSSLASSFCPMPYSKGYPVALANGEVRLDVTDLYVASRGFPFVWRRTYSSRAGFDSVYGHNWTHAYDRRIQGVAGGVSLADGLGREDFYQDLGGGAYLSPAGIFDRLVQSGGGWLQTDAQGMKYTYNASGWLVQIQDRAGNTLTITRNAFHHISQVEDTQGRLYTVAYANPGPAEKFQSLTDFSGRVIVYTLDGNGDLFKVRSPLVVGTPNGNDFPLGKTTLYGYTSGNADPRLNHNLERIVQPLYNVGDSLASSKPMVVFTYSTATLDTAVDFDHVTSQRWGHDQGGPLSSPNLVVGGTISLAYTNSLGGDPDAPAGAVLRTTQTDANGNLSAHYFDAAREEVKRIERTNRDIRPGEGDYATFMTYTAEGLLSEITLPRANSVAFLFDSANPSRAGQGNLLEIRRKDNALGTQVDLVTRFTREPVFNRPRTTTDPRAFPAGTVPLDGSGHLDLADASVARYTTWNILDYQEGTGFQAARGIPAAERIPDGLGDQNGAPDFDAGNVVEVRHPVIQTAGSNLGQAIVEERTWNERAQPLTWKNGEGHIDAYAYFPTNSVPNDPSDLEGYLQSEVHDQGGFNLTTTYGRDVRGNEVSRTDPKGRTSTRSVNALDQVVRQASRPIEKPLGGTYTGYTDSFFNLNDDLISTSGQNLKEDGAPYPHASVVDTFEHDILHNRVAESLDKSRNDNSVVGTVRTEHLYDPNLNRVATRFPEAVSGAQPTNISTTLFDERDLTYKSTQGDNDTDPANAPPVDAPVLTMNYDANRNVLETIDVVRNAVRAGAPATAFPGSAAGDVTKRIYDGFDRPTSLIDGEGSVRDTAYDLASNAVLETLTGPVDHTAEAQVRLLARTDTVFDELSRVVSVDRAHFVTETGAAIGDGHSVHLMAYDKDNRKTGETDDNGHTTTTVWDTAGRKRKEIDALLNETEWVRDANSNVTTILRREVSSDLGSPVATLTSTQAFDGEDRLIQAVSSAGDVTDLALDFRGNLVLTSDPVRGAGYPTGPGNKILRAFDALRREISTTRLLTSNGRGDGAPVGQILTRKSWDDDSRLVSETDDNGHATLYQWDGADRKTRITHADATFSSVHFDADNQETTKTDANVPPTLFTQTFDGRGLLMDCAIQRGFGVVGATVERRRYDGAGRLTLTQQDDLQNTGIKDRAFRWDSLSNQTQDKQLGTYLVDREFDGEGNCTKTIYPGKFGGGRRVVLRTFDAIHRVKAISEDTSGALVLAPQAIVPLATMHYRGRVFPSPERVTYGDDATPLYIVNSVFDTFPRLLAKEARTGSGASVGAGQLVAGFEYGYDRMGRKLYEKRTHDANLGSVYVSDSAYRITKDLQDVDLSAVAPGTEIDPGAFSSSTRFEQVLDGAGNRSSVTQYVSGAPTTTTYAMNATDALTNRITSLSGGLNLNFTYTAGGFPYLERFRLYADPYGRQVGGCDLATNALLRYMAYDVLGCWYLDYDKSGGVEGNYTAPPSQTTYLWDGEQLIEERDRSTGAVKRQYVWGPGTNRLIQETTATATYWAFPNEQGSIAALGDNSGNVLERYKYGLYGERSVAPDAGTGNRIGFQGSYHDLETGMVRMGARTLEPRMGRWVQRDPVGAWEGDSLGNAYAFVGNDPVNGRDPSGLAEQDLKQYGDLIGRSSSLGALPTGPAPKVWVIPTPPPPPSNEGEEKIKIKITYEARFKGIITSWKSERCWPVGGMASRTLEICYLYSRNWIGTFTLIEITQQTLQFTLAAQKRGELGDAINIPIVQDTSAKIFWQRTGTFRQTFIVCTSTGLPLSACDVTSPAWQEWLENQLESGGSIPPRIGESGGKWGPAGE